MGAWMPFTVRLSPARTGGSGPTPNSSATTVPWTLGASPGPDTMAIPHGVNPGAPLAPLLKLVAVMLGPGARTVRENCADWMRTEAVTVPGPTPVPAVAPTLAFPLTSVTPVGALSVA